MCCNNKNINTVHNLYSALLGNLLAHGTVWEPRSAVCRSALLLPVALRKAFHDLSFFCLRTQLHTELGQQNKHLMTALVATAADSTMHIYTNIDSIVPKQHSSACARVQLFRASHAKCSNILWSVMQEFNCRGHWSHGKNCIRDCNKVRAAATTQLKSPSKL